MTSNGKLNFWMEKQDFPRGEIYDALTEILTQKSFVILPLLLKNLGNHIVDGKPPVPEVEKATANLLIFLEQIENCIKWSVTEQLRVTDRREIFRENSLAATLIQWTFKLEGERFLKDALRGPITDLCNSSDDLEIDPFSTEGRLLPEEVERNSKAIAVWTKRFLDGLAGSLGSFPPLIRTVCSIVRECVFERYSQHPDCNQISTDAICNFLILRWVALAIISPAQYKIIGAKTVRTPKQKRNLLIIAKMIQGIAFNSEFKSHFARMTPLVKELQPQFTLFLSKLRQSEFTCYVCDDVVPKVLNAFSDPSVVESASIFIKFLQSSVDPDAIVKLGLHDFYPHIVEQTGKYTVDEMMEMLRCFSRLKWIISTDWFTGSST